MTATAHTGERARLIDLAQPMRRGMPQSPNHPPFRMVLERRHGDMVRSDGGSAANEVIITGGHVGTHVDALAHVSQDGLVYGGLGPDGITGHNGFSELGIDDFTPYVGRCLLLDVAAVHGVRTLPAGYEITAADLDEAAAGLDPRPGEALLIGTGWSRLWADGPAFTGREDGVPGPGEEAGHRLAEWRPAVVGGETIAFERLAPGLGHATLPVHRILLVESGINIVETMKLDELLDSGVREFTLVLNPLNIVGATGAPVRPLAILGDLPVAGPAASGGSGGSVGSGGSSRSGECGESGE
ncbi:cyclase family protein [Streptomyces sp. CAU 1734]|uniref:cyclase family protein n=1 Tax=Streptomyces sp. CAU 1734 TaxID=3140360 RepID=UPI003261B6B3